MPIYELYCKNCKTSKDILTKYEEYKNTEYTCDNCHNKLHKIVTTCNFSLKGDGFYKPSPTDFDESML